MALIIGYVRRHNTKFFGKRGGHPRSFDRNTKHANIPDDAVQNIQVYKVPLRDVV